MTIVELRRRRAEVISRMRALNDGVEQREDPVFTAEEDTEYRALDAELTSLNERCERAERIEAVMVRQAGSNGPSPAARPEAGPRRAEAQEDEFMVSRCIRAMSAGGSVPRALDVAEREWGPDDAATRALAATDATAGGVFITPDYAADTIELLRPASVVRSMNPIMGEMQSGIFQMPGIASGAQASYFGEGDDIPASEMKGRAVQLVAKPLGTLVPVQNALLRRQSRVNDRVIRDDVVASLAERSDLAFIRGPGSAASPKGIRYWVPSANVLTANATVNLATVTDGFSQMGLTLENANVRMRNPGYLMSPRTKHFLMGLRDGNGNYAYRDEMKEGQLNGQPFKATSQIPSNLGGGNVSELYQVDFADVVIGETLGLLISASDAAAYNDGTGLVSAYAKDQTVIRVITEHDLGMRHVESGVVMLVTWGS
ncbi:MAG TPA: phage major capsid protein [Longimicrobium sp.]|nr:phage major capsid protein [Longimicrobium sp.]